MISIRRSAKEDIPSVMDFISTYWVDKHVLSKSLKLLDWQYGTEDGFNFILAWDEAILVGVLGYIPTRRYDEKLSANTTIWLALWLVHDEYQSSMLGLKLLKALEVTEPHVAIAVNGVNLKAVQIYKALGYSVEDLCQYYLVNTTVPQNVLQNPKNLPLATAVFGRAIFKRMHASDLEYLGVSIETNSWLKTPEFFNKRFLQHPFYEYYLYGIFLSGKPHAVIASRIAKYKSSRVLRVVDFTGDADVLGDCGSAFENLMAEHNVEYMDFWQFGIESEILERSGFQAVDLAGELICPNYFEPFVKKNGRIICCFKGRVDRPLIVCRADGDQDRPNEI